MNISFLRIAILHRTDSMRIAYAITSAHAFRWRNCFVGSRINAQFMLTLLSVVLSAFFVAQSTVSWGTCKVNGEIVEMERDREINCTQYAISSQRLAALIYSLPPSLPPLYPSLSLSLSLVNRIKLRCKQKEILHLAMSVCVFHVTWRMQRHVATSMVMVWFLHAQLLHYWYYESVRRLWVFGVPPKQAVGSVDCARETIHQLNGGDYRTTI